MLSCSEEATRPGRLTCSLCSSSSKKRARFWSCICAHADGAAGGTLQLAQNPGGEAETALADTRAAATTLQRLNCLTTKTAPVGPPTPTPREGGRNRLLFASEENCAGGACHEPLAQGDMWCAGQDPQQAHETPPPPPPQGPHVLGWRHTASLCVCPRHAPQHRRHPSAPSQGTTTRKIHWVAHRLWGRKLGSAASQKSRAGIRATTGACHPPGRAAEEGRDARRLGQTAHSHTQEHKPPAPNREKPQTTDASWPPVGPRCSHRPLRQRAPAPSVPSLLPTPLQTNDNAAWHGGLCVAAAGGLSAHVYARVRVKASQGAATKTCTARPAPCSFGTRRAPRRHAQSGIMASKQQWPACAGPAASLWPEAADASPAAACGAPAEPSADTRQPLLPPRPLPPCGACPSIPPPAGRVA